MTNLKKWIDENTERDWFYVLTHGPCYHCVVREAGMCAERSGWHTEKCYKNFYAWAESEVEG